MSEDGGKSRKYNSRDSTGGLACMPVCFTDFLKVKFRQVY